MSAADGARARGLAALRIILGLGFLYAGLEKLLDFAGSGAPWSAAGFLRFGTAGSIPNMVGLSDPMTHNPTQAVWLGLAGSPVLLSLVDFLVVSGEIAIGIALVLGIATRLAGTLGAVMMFLFWLAAWDFQYGVINLQFVYMVASAVVVYTSAGRAYGLDARIASLDRVRSSPGLRLVVG